MILILTGRTTTMLPKTHLTGTWSHYQGRCTSATSKPTTWQRGSIRRQRPIPNVWKNKRRSRAWPMKRILEVEFGEIWNVMRWSRTTRVKAGTQLWHLQVSSYSIGAETPNASKVIWNTWDLSHSRLSSQTSLLVNLHSRTTSTNSEKWRWSSRTKPDNLTWSWAESGTTEFELIITYF